MRWLALGLAACTSAPETAPETEFSADPPEFGVSAGEVPSVAPSRPRYFVVTTDELFSAAEVYAARRSQQGWDASVVSVSELSPDGDAETLASSLRAHLDPEQRTAVLLLGDAETGLPAHPCQTVDDASAECLAQFDDHFPWSDLCYTDNPYGDIDADGLPDAAVGRIPAASEAEALAYFDRMVRFEEETVAGPWNRRVSLYAGASGYSETLEALAESVTLDALAEVAPAYDIVGAWNNPQSDYFYTPFDEKVVDMFEEGALAVFYVGHGSASSNDGLSSTQLNLLEPGARSPFAFFFACSNGTYAGESRSLAERALFAPGGPISAYAGSSITSPFSNAALPYEMQRELLEGASPTLGEVVQNAERALIGHQDTVRDTIDAAMAFEGTFSAECGEPQNRIHVELYNLFGDPAMPVQRPEIAAIGVDGWMADGELLITGNVPFESGTVTVSLDVERDRILGTLSPSTDPASVQANWEAANDKRWLEVEATVLNGAFEVPLSFDPDALPPGPLFVRAYASDGTHNAVAAVPAPAF